jgi:hypothetical protein
MVLSAISPEVVVWYDSLTGGTQLGSGSQFTTPVLSGSTTYYVESASQTCNSARVPINITLFTPPVHFLGNDTIVASGTPLTLQADPNAIGYIWTTGETTASITVQSSLTNDSTGFYSVTCLYPGGCIASDNIRVDFSTAVQDPSSPVVIQGVYPNPVRNHAQLVLQARSGVSATVELMDIAGRTIFTQKKSLQRGKNQVDLSVEENAAGVYFVRIRLEEHPDLLYKIIVE